MRIGTTPRIWQNMEDGRAVRDLHKHIAAIAREYDADRDWLMWGGPLNEETPAGPDGPDGGNECARRDSNPKPSGSPECVVRELRPTPQVNPGRWAA